MNKNKEYRSFRDFARYLDYKARKAGVPLNGQFELTPLCNFRCEMCYVHLAESQMGRALLSPEQIRRFLEQIS